MRTYRLGCANIPATDREDEGSRWVPAGVVQADAGTSFDVIAHTVTTKIASEGVIGGSFTFDLI